MNLKVKYYSKNYLINRYFEDKEIRQDQDIKVEFVEIGNTQNLSGYMLIKQNIESMNLSKNRKKTKSHYVEVIFAGLRQPTKNIKIETYSVLSEFIKRFKISTLDICFDGEHQRDIDKKLYNSSIFYDYIGEKTKPKLVNTTFYINNPTAPTVDADYFQKIVLYDKYRKESRHRNLDNSLVYWKRLEFRVLVNMKLKESHGLVDYLEDIKRVAKAYFKCHNIDDYYFIQQLKYLTDKRTHKKGILV